MKKIINGAQYNTETAKELGTWSNDHSSSDFGFCAETLYRTKAGKYFLHGRGGAMSKYSRSCGNNSWGWGEHIEPLTPSAAVKWAEENLTADEYTAIFGEPDEAADGREALNLTVPVEIKQKLLKMREDTGKSISQIITEIVSIY